ncbi:MAG: hypothetical protein JOZ90_16165 [Alphaproteobacteria bacterium]|nr:hypothetical protein [Alphaproteobacteria bacterium]MBV9373350.1 hypothetical protein [Alphaproteobacteria bacterium]MBV9902609.1 hypothetical protein [Alphaproteobacteria bacterium]
MARPPLLALLVLGGCAAGPGTPWQRGIEPDRVATTGTRILPSDRASEATMAAARQVKRCYRSPGVPSAGRRIVTRLRVRYAADGRLEEAPQLVEQQGVTPDNQAYAAPMAEAASMAVLRCSPLHLPPELHRGGWDTFDLTFSPNVLV